MNLINGTATSISNQKTHHPRSMTLKVEKCWADDKQAAKKRELVSGIRFGGGFELGFVVAVVGLVWIGEKNNW